jgi:hypothetical protein
MNNVMDDQIRTTLRHLFKGCGDVEVEEKIRVHSPKGTNEGWNLTFEQLSKAAERFSTNHVYLEYHSGWLGTHTTPGHPSRCTVVITDWTFTAEFRA